MANWLTCVPSLPIRANLALPHTIFLPPHFFHSFRLTPPPILGPPTRSSMDKPWRLKFSISSIIFPSDLNLNYLLTTIFLTRLYWASPTHAMVSNNLMPSSQSERLLLLTRVSTRDKAWTVDSPTLLYLTSVDANLKLTRLSYNPDHLRFKLLISVYNKFKWKPAINEKNFLIIPVLTWLH